MLIQQLTMMPLEIPFRLSFKHAAAERDRTASVWVEAVASDGTLRGAGEGCPREYVTEESIPSAIAWFRQHAQTIKSEVTSLASLRAWVHHHASLIDQAPAAWCAIELALLDLLGREAGQSLEALLQLPTLDADVQYSAVLGDGSQAGFERQVQTYTHVGFRDFKIKLSGDLQNDREKIACLNNTGLSLRIRADANNFWRDPREAIRHIERLGQPFWAIEEPLAARDFAGLSLISKHLGVHMILDESLTQARDLEAIAEVPGKWLPNLRVSKAGGVLRSLALLTQARSFGMQVIIGAHVGETSVLSRAALALASAAGAACAAMEGAFGTHLLQYDVCTTPLMFCAGGMVRCRDADFARQPGSGLTIARPVHAS
jgi:L-alanine-DL-glutamate epimerase-like enolase superfamily enzyme